MIRTAAQVSFLILALSGVALAHEKGAIQLSSKQVEAGSKLSVRGERLSKNSTFRFELRGSLKTFNLGPATSDLKGILSADIALPPEVGPGSYALVLIATDGDESARADLAVIPAVAAATADEHAGHEDMPGMDMAAHQAATADMMPLDVKTTGGEWFTIAAFSALSLAGGLGLLRRRRA